MKCPPVAALLLFLPTWASAHPLHPDATEPPHPSAIGLEIPPGVESISVPFRLVNQHILLPATVNGQGPLQIVLDTGMPAEGIALNDTERVVALHLNYLENSHVLVGGAGGSGKAKPARIAEGLTVRIGDLELHDCRAMLLPPIPGFAAYSDGVIGAALFRHFTVTLDNDRSVMTLRRPGSYQPPEGATVLPLADGHPGPKIEARVRVGDGESVPVKLVVDLGATHVVALNEGPRVAAPERSIQTVIGRGVGGTLTGKVGRIHSLELGSISLTEVVATFPEKQYQSPGGLDFADGNLGNGALNRFNVTFDYAGGRMVLQPARRIAEPFEWDMSGMVAEPTEGGEVRVREVLTGSPAAEAGVRKDDRVVQIAQQPVDAVTFFEARQKLRVAGETVAVKLLRAGKPVEVSLKLRRLI